MSTPFTKKMRKTHTILVPSMAPIHFSMLVRVLQSFGYNVELLNNMTRNVVSEGLKFVHNDTCYPALLVIGQFIDALNSGKYDVNKVALCITQTGGGCRASNYIHLLRKALDKAGYGFVPVLSLNMSNLEKGFKITLKMVRYFLAALVYGDLIMYLRNQTEPYEVNSGEAQKLTDYWTNKLACMFDERKGYKGKEFSSIMDNICHDFSLIQIKKTPKVKVGIVGEIYVKYAALGNNDLENFLKSQDCEYNLPGILNFALYCIDTRIDDINLYGGSSIKKKIMTFLLNIGFRLEGYMIEAMKKYNFATPSTFVHTKMLVRDIIGYGNKMGEGWLLTAEMVELIESGYENIICTQPFGCLPNHICGKGMIRKIKEKNENANIVPIDYDPGATRVNQENRIKLMLAVAKEKLNKD